MTTTYSDHSGTSSETYSWTNFRASATQVLARLSRLDWLLLGQAQARCQQISSSFFAPEIVAELNQLYLARGVTASTAIEGNMLTTEQVLAIIRQEYQPVRSLKYQQQEVESYLAAMDWIRSDPLQKITLSWILELHSKVYQGLDGEDRPFAGKLRTKGVGVQNYLAPPAAECRQMLEEFCEWLSNFLARAEKLADAKHTDAADQFSRTLLGAILAHIFMALIHPFFDGNGRLSRLLEVKILMDRGVPEFSAHLLADFYNSTRPSYHRLMNQVAKDPRFPAERFIHYALAGFNDQLYDQLQVFFDQYSPLLLKG